MGLDRKDVMLGAIIMQNASISSRLRQAQGELGGIRGVLERTERREIVQANLKRLAYEARKLLEEIKESAPRAPLVAYVKVLILREGLSCAPHKLEELVEISDREYAEAVLSDTAQLHKSLETETGQESSAFLRHVKEYTRIQEELKRSESEETQVRVQLTSNRSKKQALSLEKEPKPQRPAFLRRMYANSIGKVVYWVGLLGVLVAFWSLPQSGDLAPVGALLCLAVLLVGVGWALTYHSANLLSPGINGAPREWHDRWKAWHEGHMKALKEGIAENEEAVEALALAKEKLASDLSQRIRPALLAHEQRHPGILTTVGIDAALALKELGEPSKGGHILSNSINPDEPTPTGPTPAFIEFRQPENGPLPVKVRCPKCKVVMVLPDGWNTTRAKCTACAALFIIPDQLLARLQRGRSSAGPAKPAPPPA